jgi:hypothetical protein
MLSSQLSLLPVIAASQWDLLRQDINKCYKHITNADSTILDVDPQDIILAGDANAYKVAADYCETNKATANAAQLTFNVDSDSITVAWNGTRTYKMTYTWTSSDVANHWFNLGGYFVIDLSGSNAVSSKDIDWRDNILNAIPTQTYTRANWVTPTNIDVYEYGNNAVYSENYARIVCTKVSDTQLDISVIISDVDSGDQQNASPTPGLPVDENVDTDVYASITRYSSFDAIVSPSIVATPVTAFESTTPVVVDLLIVGGGGAGGTGWPDPIGGGGGGGGGGGVSSFSTTLQAGLSYPVVVGAGGIGVPYPTPGQGGSGGNSSIAGFVSFGGTGGFTQGGGYSAIGGNAGIYTTDGWVTGQVGGTGGSYNQPGGYPGGGGGGSDDIPGGSGAGANGRAWPVTTVVYGGGGGGGADYSTNQPGGLGGGGAGGSNVAGVAGTPNTGGGGGGGGSSSGSTYSGDGGSGVVVVSYSSGSPLFSGGTVTTSGGRYYHTFTTNGTLS